MAVDSASSQAPAESTATYFISDLHLQESQPQLTAAFEHFLFSMTDDAEAIYILGDFVDAWVGDDDTRPHAQHLRELLAKRANINDTPIYFMHGNRDFLIGEHFAKAACLQLLNETEVIDLYGTPTLLLHGDQLCTDDHDYQAFRSKVRDLKWQQKMLRYPLWLRKTIAAYMRYRSRKAHREKSAEIMDANDQTVIEYFDRYNITRMIHGHTHRPGRHEHQVHGEKCERIVLGDWGKTGWVFRCTKSTQDLIEFTV